MFESNEVEILKYIGFCFLLFAVFSAAKEYRRVIFARVAECRAFLSFIRHMRLKAGCFLATPRECAEDFESEVLSKLGFTEKILECGDIYESYKYILGKLHLSREEKEVLEMVFKKAGDGYLDEAVKLFDTAEKQLSEILSALEVEIPKRAKLVSALTVTGSIGFLILLI